MTPILFIHGFSGSKKEYQPVLKYLKEKGINNFYEFEYLSTVGLHPIKVVAKELDEFIEKNVKEKEINIVAISQGGIIALAYLKYFEYKKVSVKKIFTLCSPHKGSLLANVLNLPGLIDLRPKSNLLKDLENFIRDNKIDVYAVYTPFDLMVFPGWNAKTKYGKNKIIFAPSHPAAFYWPATFKYVYKNLN